MPDVNKNTLPKCENISKTKQNKFIIFCALYRLSPAKNSVERLFDVETAQKQVSMTTITQCRPTHCTVRKRHTTPIVPIHQGDYSTQYHAFF